jgi:NAD(P)-dependent dehydrogenase (short-subunit alcohol dehydrogenase family)
MLESGEAGVVVNTSSQDGGVAPVPYASVYASSKAAVSCFTEALAHQLAAAGGSVRAAVFYPSGGLLETGLWTAQRNRPPALARQKERAPAPGTTFAEFKDQLAAAGLPTDVVDLTELGRFVLQGVKDGKFVISHGMEDAAELLHARADALAKGSLPPAARL